MVFRSLVLAALLSVDTKALSPSFALAPITSPPISLTTHGAGRTSPPPGRGEHRLSPPYSGSAREPPPLAPRRSLSGLSLSRLSSRASDDDREEVLLALLDDSVKLYSAASVALAQADDDGDEIASLRRSEIMALAESSSCLLALTKGSAAFSEKVEGLLNLPPPAAAAAAAATVVPSPPTPTMPERVDPSLVSRLDEAVMLAASYDGVGDKGVTTNDEQDMMFDAVVELAKEYHRSHLATPPGGLLPPPLGTPETTGEEKMANDLKTTTMTTAPINGDVSDLRSRLENLSALVPPPVDPVAPPVDPVAPLDALIAVVADNPVTPPPAVAEGEVSDNDDATEGRKDSPMIIAEVPETSDVHIAAPTAAENSPNGVLDKDEDELAADIAVGLDAIPFYIMSPTNE